MTIFVEQLSNIIITNLWWVLISSIIVSSAITYWFTQSVLRAKQDYYMQTMNAQLTSLQEANTEYKVANGALSASLQSLQQSSKEKMSWRPRWR